MPRRRRRPRQMQLAFDSLVIEGGLISPDWLSKISQLQAPGQSDSDYMVPKGLNLRDEIGRYWRIAQAIWAEFQVVSSDAADPLAVTERFVCALFEDVLSFGPIAEASSEADGQYALSHFGLDGRVPIAVASAAEGLDAPSNRFGD